MKKIRIGVIGVGRGKSMIRYCEAVDTAEVVAICDKWVEGLEIMKKKMTGHNQITYYTDYDEFLKHDMDAVVLANYATEHAPFAIKAMKAGKHVLSEVLPVQTMKEAVELVEAVEEKASVVKAFVVGDGLKEIEFKLGDLTDNEREIILKGCLINYYRG